MTLNEVCERLGEQWGVYRESERRLNGTITGRTVWVARHVDGRTPITAAYPEMLVAKIAALARFEAALAPIAAQERAEAERNPRPYVPRRRYKKGSSPLDGILSNPNNPPDFWKKAAGGTDA